MSAFVLIHADEISPPHVFVNVIMTTSCQKHEEDTILASHIFCALHASLTAFSLWLCFLNLIDFKIFVARKNYTYIGFSQDFLRTSTHLVQYFNSLVSSVEFWHEDCCCSQFFCRSCDLSEWVGSLCHHFTQQMLCFSLQKKHNKLLVLLFACILGTGWILVG